jgi:glycosyltransferase involved in cell wall biosynthesis
MTSPSALPFVSVIIPMRNEERSVGACLDSLLANHYPSDKLEIVVVDGQSTDRSREIVQVKRRHSPQIRLLENPRKLTPVAMNIGIRAARGEVVCMINAHAYVSPDFLKRSIQTLQEHEEAEAVGGILCNVNEGGLGKAIALALNSPLGAGGARYRTRTTPGLICDTVPYAAYRRAVFTRIGLIDEELIRNQDAEFNYRLLQRGGRIYFNPDIVSYLTARASLYQLARQQFQTGYWKVRLFQKVFLRTNWRHLVPAVFVIVTAVSGIAAVFSLWGRWLLMADVGAYAAAVVVGSCVIAVRHGAKNLLLLPWVFSVIHISYGIGMSKGFWDFVILPSRRKTQCKAEP